MNLTDEVQARDELVRAMESRKPDAIARAATSNVWPLYSSHYELLVSAIERLPSALLDRHPVLRVLHRMTPVLAQTGRPFKPLVYPDDARAMSTDELDVLTVAQMVAFRFSGDLTASVIYAQRLEERIRQTRVESRERTDGPLWFYHEQIGSTYLLAGDSSRALQSLATARQLASFSRQPDAERVTLGRLALAHAARGSIVEAEQALALIDGHPEPTRAHENSVRWTERTDAALNSVDRMSTDMEERLADLEPFDSFELTWPFALLARTRALVATQRPDAALEAINLARQSHADQYGGFAPDVIASTTIEASLAGGDPATARRAADASTVDGDLTRIAMIRLALHEGGLNTAAKGLRRMAAEPNLAPGRKAAHRMLTAWLELARNDELSHETAARIAHLSATGYTRRLLATMPQHLIDAVSVKLASDEAREFQLATAGLHHPEVHSRPPLTKGELRVLDAIVDSGTTAEIASTFHVSPNTVKSQLKSLYRKLGAASREEAIEIGVRLQLIGAEPD